jgi:type IV secretion system protein VirD4
MTKFLSNQPPINNQSYSQPSYSIIPYIEHMPKRLAASNLAEVHMSAKLKQSYDSKPQLHGSASFMKINEVIGLGLNQQGKERKISPYLGYIPHEDNNGPFANIYARSPSFINNPQDEELPEGNGHLLTIAPTRAGKGTGQIITNLLTWLGSVLVLDVKGENYLLSAGNRRCKMGQNVFHFSPFEEDTHIWNPIMSIRTNLNWSESTRKERCQEEEDSCYLTNLLISNSGSEHDDFWETQAKSFLKGLLLYVRTADLTLKKEDINNSDLQHRVSERSMRDVRRLLTLNEDGFSSLLDDMCESKRNHIREAGNILNRLLSGEGKTGQSIIAMLLKQTNVWSFERVHIATYKSSANPDDREPAPNNFDFSQMRDGNTSIYLIIPPEYLSEYRSVLRVMIGVAMRDLKDSYTTDSKYHDQPPVLLILDEFPQLGYMKPIEDALSYLAGYGVRFWFFVQDISQLKLHYQNSWQTFIANTETKCFFGINDLETAKLVSEMIGTATVDQFSYTNGTSSSYTNGYQNGYLNNYSETRSYSGPRNPDNSLSYALSKNEK